MSVTNSGKTVFQLRTPAHIKTCHMTGSWDNYAKRIPMSPDTAAGPGWWTLTLKFGSSMQPGRYWYYYILDGYFESHDPNKPTVQEPARNITLNILDYVHPRDRSPASSTSSSSKRSGGYYSPPSDTSSRTSASSRHSYQPHGTRTPSPRRCNMELAHLVHPKPRNPLGNHKLTLDTGAGYRASTITNAATTAGDSPVSAGSGRSSASLDSNGSYCSTCSGTTWSSGSSPTTPMCTCPVASRHKDCEYESDGFDYSDDEGSCFEDEGREPARVYRLSRGEVEARRKTYHADEELAYRLERGLRM